jgi:hypothetical protein
MLYKVAAILAASLHDGAFRTKIASLKDRMAFAEHNNCGLDKMLLLMQMAVTENKDGDH